MKALKERQSVREYADEKLSEQQLSDLIWAAAGKNRESGGRTNPSPRGANGTDLYVILEEGIYLYNVDKHELQPIAQGDYRESAGTQDFVKTAPVNLVYVVDWERFGAAPDDLKARWAGMEAGAMSQNAYLYCAAEGLGAVVRTSINQNPFAEHANLKETQSVQCGQSVGKQK